MGGTSVLGSLRYYHVMIHLDFALIALLAFLYCIIAKCTDVLLCVHTYRVTINHILQRHAAAGTLVPGKSTRAPQKTMLRQDCALFRMVRQNRFKNAGALTAWMRNLYGMRAGQKTNNNRLLRRGYHACLWTRKESPIDCQLPPTPLGVGTEVAEPDNGPLAACHLRWWSLTSIINW